MGNRKMQIILILGLILTAVVCGAILCGCAFKAKASSDLMEGIEPKELGEVGKVSQESAEKATDFAVRLFRTCNEEDKNTLVSPLSVFAALAMTANGAKEETLAQMEDVLGMNRDEMNRFFRSYVRLLPSSDKYKINLADSIWFTSDERFTVNRDFLQTNADYFGADAYKAPFDETTLKEINGWVKKNTDGMIPEILDKIQKDAVMYLVNALAFEAEWDEVYTKVQVQKGQFTREDGTQKEVEFMYATETRYLEDENATGFLKYYKGYKYAFAALLPNEGVNLTDYLASLDGKSLNELLSHPVTTTVFSAIPKFETEYNIEMSAVLTAMGMPTAFDPNNADFSGLGVSTGGNISISRVIHKTFISVAEQGTKAGAATVVEMTDGVMALTETKQVYLDRPFVYMLIDTETNIPFFIGTLTDIERGTR